MRQRMTKRSIFAALAALLIVVSAASAYFLFFESGHGTTSPAKIGLVQNTGELGLGGTIANTLTEPGQVAEVSVQVTNSSSQPQRISKMTATPVVDEPYLKEGCKPEWFTVTSGGIEGERLQAGLTTSDSIPIGTSTLPQHLNLHFLEEETNQNACSAAQVQLALTSTP